jgi:NADP-dependent 3-hydroxy acid dehydrogenase YdfG
MKLKDKVILITGAARGLGKEVANELTHAGSTVIATDMRKGELEETVHAINQSKDNNLGKIVAMDLDVRDEKQAEKVIEGVIKDYGHIDVLVNNAGVNVTASTETLSIEEWDRIVNTNLRGNYVMSHLVFPYMKQQGTGHIINIASSLAKRVKENSPAYVASKWGILGLSQILFMDGRKHGIKVAAFSPAGMRTRLILDRFPDIDQTKLLDPADVAKTIRVILELPDSVSVPDIFVISAKEETWP